jgi:hypothetical protein
MRFALKILLFGTLCTVLLLCFGACFDPLSDGNYGTVRVNLPGGAPPRAVFAEALQTRPADLRYTITLNGPGGEISESIVNPKAGFSQDFSVVSGTWDITVTAYSTDTAQTVQGKGTDTVPVRAGETVRALIHLRAPSEIGISLDGFIEGLPETIVLSKTGTDFPLRMNLRVAGDTVYDTYEWYLNENTNPVSKIETYTLEAANCREDKNTLAVEVVKDFMFYSKAISFTVTQ